MSGYRNPFTVDEERKILHYIFHKNGFYRLRGLQFWKELERDEIPSRSYQSLHERFRKYIINNIQNPAYGLSFEEQIKLKRIYEEGGRGKVSRKTTPQPVYRPEVSGNLARNFFEISDSDDSDGGEIISNCQRKSNSCRNKEGISSNGNNTNEMLRYEETNSPVDENRVSTGRPSTSAIEIDSACSSSDSEVFNLQDQTDENKSS